MEHAITNAEGLRLAKRIAKPKHTREEAEYFVANLVTVEVNSNQFSALVSFTMSVGVKMFARSSLLKFVNQSEPFLAADEFPRWSVINGMSHKKVAALREEQAKLFLKPTLVSCRG